MSNGCTSLPGSPRRLRRTHSVSSHSQLAAPSTPFTSSASSMPTLLPLPSTYVGGNFSSAKETMLPRKWWCGLSRRRDCASKASPVPPLFCRLPKPRVSSAPWSIDVGTGDLNSAANLLLSAQAPRLCPFLRPAPRRGRQDAVISAALPPSLLLFASRASAKSQRSYDTNDP